MGQGSRRLRAAARGPREFLHCDYAYAKSLFCEKRLRHKGPHGIRRTSKRKNPFGL